MFTRIVSMTLKPNVSTQFTQLLEQKLVPALRKEPGFLDEVVLVVPGGPEVVAISIWKTREDRDNYARGAYRKVRKLGIIGGMSWSSTALYYDHINRAVAQRLGGLNSATLGIESLNFAQISAMESAGDWDGIAKAFLDAETRLEA